MTAPPGSTNKFVNNQSPQCLTIYNAQTSPSSPIVDWPCALGGDEQSWQSNEGTLQSVLNPKMCLDVFGGQALAGASATIAPCSNADTQQWKFDGKYLTLQSVTNLCLGVASPAPVQGGLIVIDTCAGAPGQIWSYLK
ncbi:RICIN domain-containing protein [Micromonospora sp. DT233]|uniref:RICIN domain-containing protein n=1 Tax=Micromonospora sp. DT233 TaxID=3393432 RepID=UPI003CF61C21